VVCGTDDTTLTAAIAMYFVTAGQMAQLRAVEGFLGPAQLEVMPVHVADILQQTRQSLAATWQHLLVMTTQNMYVFYQSAAKLVGAIFLAKVHILKVHL